MVSCYGWNGWIFTSMTSPGRPTFKPLLQYHMAFVCSLQKFNLGLLLFVVWFCSPFFHFLDRSSRLWWENTMDLICKLCLGKKKKKVPFGIIKHGAKLTPCSKALTLTTHSIRTISSKVDSHILLLDNFVG